MLFYLLVLELFSGYIIHNGIWQLLQALLMGDENFTFQLRNEEWNSLRYQQRDLFKLV